MKILPLAWPRSLRSRGLRLWSGSVLGLFILGHFINVALGLISVRAMEIVRPVLGGIWNSRLGSALLVGALLIHFGLALRALFIRRTLRMSAREAWQLGFGLALPFLVVAHVMAARIEPALTGEEMTFALQVRALWIDNPVGGGRQAAALLVAWAHGCFGFWFALRGRHWFQRWSWLLLQAAVLVPLLALLGFAEAGREIAEKAPPAVHAIPAGLVPEDLRTWLYLGFALPIAGVLLARALRYWWGRHRRFRVTYPDGRSLSVPRGTSVLEASRIGNIPHVSLCGGRGRCSTCRVRVTEGFDRLTPASAHELATLARSSAAPDVRLACQLRPNHDIAVRPLLSVPRRRVGNVVPPRATAVSHERELAVLFCDLRGFTQRAEHWLPFDTVFLLNRYFAEVGEAVDAAGGYLDKFIGDGALALFGLDTTPDEACRQALAAAAGVAQRLRAMNAELGPELGEPLRIAMGLHVGPAVVGDMGFGSAVGLTAVGDAINVASRLESEAKERDVEAVASTALLTRAGHRTLPTDIRDLAIRGRVAAVEVMLVADATLLRRTTTGSEA